MLTFFHATQVFQDQRPNTTAMRVVVQLHCGAHRVNLAHKKKGGGLTPSWKAVTPTDKE